MKDVSSEELLFLGGDFNCTINDKLDRNHLEPHTASQKALTQIIKTFDLCDIWRKVHYKDRQYTWVHSRDNLISMARLDRLYVFNFQANLVRDCKIIPVSFSDHCSVIGNFFINSVTLKSAYWHLNTSLLKISLIFLMCFGKILKNKNSFILPYNSGGIVVKSTLNSYVKNILSMLQKRWPSQ